MRNPITGIVAITIFAMVNAAINGWQEASVAWLFAVIFYLLVINIPTVIFLWSLKRNARLPTAELKVDGNTIVFHYKKLNRGQSIKYLNATTLEDMYPLRFIAFNKSVEMPNDLEEGHAVTAVLTFEEKRIEFPMMREYARCTCDIPVPHWTGNSYIGFFQKTEEDTQLSGGILLLVLNRNNRKKRRRRRSWKELRAPQLVPDYRPM